MDLLVRILAGPNGAGKTTFADNYVPRSGEAPYFINADMIARGLSPFAPEKAAFKAGRLMLMEMEDLTRQRVGFTFESTLSGRSWIRWISRWRTAGYWVEIVYLGLSSAELAVRRVAFRVEQGGHGVAEEVIRRRYSKSLQNFHGIYKSLVDSWFFYNNDDDSRDPVLVDLGGRDE